MTGGARGLGQAMAERLGKEGCRVVIADIDVASMEKTVANMNAAGTPTEGYRIDLTKTSEIDAMIEYVATKYGRIDILINNAGISWVADSLNFPMDKFLKVFNLNLFGAFQLSALAAKTMIPNGGGKIINIASIGGLGGDVQENVDSVPYVTSKAAMIAMTKDLAVKWARYGINVNAICPGWFPTSLNDELLESRKDDLLSRIPLGRYGTEDDLKGLVVYLASAASKYVTGQYIVVDGGQTARV